MKTAFFAAALLIANFAHASFNTDVPGKAVRCHVANTTIAINKARTQITVTYAYDPGHPEVYNVLANGRTSDGDTFVTYEGQPVGSGDSVLLSFDDQGDQLAYGHDAANPIPLKCH